MRLLIIGAGFAGMYAALSSARLRDIQGVSPDDLEIALIAPEPTLVVRPRLYEPKPETLTAPLLDVLRAIDVDYIQGSAETIDTKARMVQIATPRGTRTTLSYDRLVIATGSRLFRPNIPGLAEHGFSVDSLDDAIALDKHLHGLADRPAVTDATRSSLPAAASPASRRQPSCPRACATSSARTPGRASSSSSATARSRPTWAKTPARSSRMRCESSASRCGSGPASSRSTNPA
ncbi:putative dehydrogenase, oxidoreductase FAD flavoprotein [Bradyrhizobium diazoefficiens]|uniref:Putative dehydrogenase, oxidoreductase FAD flavoprotein n=1 Tax=Bradyrhizobium diazoefficiens TaxID=1355477 RepID=A0A0E4G0A5_9BRAD|nr:putative dehydrogenase, oxidoreductase FAD flavoprotein [Bradyrhizobium diazoefficiens]